MPANMGGTPMPRGESNPQSDPWLINSSTFTVIPPLLTGRLRRPMWSVWRSNGLSALALTDHDTIGGIEEAAAQAALLGLDFLPGIEISCEFPRGTMHLLGYGVDPGSTVLRDLTRRLIAARDDRNPRIIRRLNELGVAITMQELEAEAGDGVVGRPHIAAILVRKGYVNSIKQAFDKYLGTGAAAYFDKERILPREAFDLIHRSGGLPARLIPCSFARRMTLNWSVLSRTARIWVLSDWK